MTTFVRCMRILEQIRRLLVIHGVSGVVRLLWAKCLGLLLWLTPARRTARAAARAKDSEFDRQYGVDTSGLMVPERTEVIGSRWAHGSRYQGVDADALGQTLIALNVDFDEFTFIDYGSGKGRAVLLASQFPFRQIIGVEYSAQLTNTAKRNLSIFRERQPMHCQKIDLICDDAIQIPVPDGPLILFLYNPFGREVMSELVQKISSSYVNRPRRIIVLYFHAVHREIWRNAGFLQEVQDAQAIAIYDTAHASEGAARTTAPVPVNRISADELMHANL